MDDPNEENIEANWVILDPLDIAEEAVEVLTEVPIEQEQLVEELSQKSLNIDKLESLSDSGEINVESDIESDGISVISESSHIPDHVEDERTVNDFINGDNLERRKVNSDFYVVSKVIMY